MLISPAPKTFSKSRKLKGLPTDFRFQKKIFFLNFQKCDFLEGFEGFFHFDVKSQKLYFFMLIWPASIFFSKSRKLKDFPTDFHKNIIMMKKHARQGFEHHYKNVCFRLKIIALFFSESCSGLGECEHVLQVFAPGNTITHSTNSDTYISLEVSRL